MSLPDVSVVVPCFNAADTLEATVASVLAQTDPNWQLILVDDESRDATPEIVDRRAASDRRMIGRHIAHGGVAAAMNRAGSDIRADRVLYLGADDLLRPAALAGLVAASRRAGERTVVTGGCELLDETARPLGVFQYAACNRFNPADLLMSNCLVGTALIPRSLLGDRPFDESLSCCEDWDVWLRLAHAGVTCQSIPQVIYGYRLRRQSLSHSADRLLEGARRVRRRWACNGVDGSIGAGGESPQPGARVVDPERLLQMEHHMAWVCGALAAASGAPRAVERYLADLPSFSVTAELEHHVAGSICWAFQFARGAIGQTWGTHRAGWLADAEDWLAQTALSPNRQAILAHLRTLAVTPADRLDQVGRWLGTTGREGRRLVIYGLGCNGVTLLDQLRDHLPRPLELAVADDSASPELTAVYGLPLADPRRWRSWPEGTLVVVTPNESAKMQATLTRAGGRPAEDFLVLASATSAA